MVKRLLAYLYKSKFVVAMATSLLIISSMTIVLRVIICNKKNIKAKDSR